MRNEVALTLPRHEDFYEVAHLVVGGVAARHDLTFEHLDDVQLALREILQRATSDGDVTVCMSVEGDTLRARVGPLAADDRVRDELVREPGSELGLRRLLDTVVDRVELGERDGGHWLELTKTLGADG